MKRMIDSELIDSLKRGELKPIAEYRFATGKLRNYGTFEGQEEILILGLEDDVGDYKCIGLGDFTLENQQVSSFAITGFDYYNDDIMYFSLNNEGKIDAVWYAKAADTQDKLYMHQITLNNESGESKRFQYITTNSTVANSIDNLSNLLGGRDVYLDTVQVLHKAGNAWRVVGGDENFVVSAVSDIVTAL